ncbi:MAG: PQQ-binding-like beta-propeller repeat protein [Spirochaetia bacterium]
MKRLSFLLLVSLLAIPFFYCSCSPSSSPSWPQWKGPTGDGISQETGWNPLALSGGAKILWKTNVGMAYSNVAIQGNRLYTMGTGEGFVCFVVCLDATTGKVIWRIPLEGTTTPQSTPTIDGNRVYIMAADDSLLCLRASNGKVIWGKRPKEDLNVEKPMYTWASSPIVEGDLLLVNANTAELGLDKMTGELKWEVHDKLPAGSNGSYTTPVVHDFDGKRCVFFLGPSSLNVLDVKTGQMLWSFPHANIDMVTEDPIVSGNAALIQTMQWCTLVESTGGTPKALWSTTEFDNWAPGTVLVDGYLYGAHWSLLKAMAFTMLTQMSGTDWPLRCVNWETGKVMWERNMEHVSMTEADGKLILLGYDGTLHIVRATSSSYEELSAADVLQGARPRPWITPPVLCGGRIYCHSFAGDVVCVDVRK